LIHRRYSNIEIVALLYHAALPEGTNTKVDKNNVKVVKETIITNHDNYYTQHCRT
jgi:hypothetical protein